MTRVMDCVREPLMIDPEMFSSVVPEPTRGFEPRTYRLQDSPSTLTMAANSYFTGHSDRSYSGASRREFRVTSGVTPAPTL